MAAKRERTKYELLLFDDFPIVAIGRRHTGNRTWPHLAAPGRTSATSHCPLPEPMFNVATFLRA
jgi:hypothetical protein